MYDDVASRTRLESRTAYLPTPDADLRPVLATAEQRFGTLALIFALVFSSSLARAEDEPATDEEQPPVEEEAPQTAEERIESLEDRIERLERQLQQATEYSIKPNTPILSGYVDFGFFVPSGDGSGMIQDFGNRYRPELAGKYTWVFLGDILATPVNSRGDAADLGPMPGIVRFDPIHSKGALGFILNEANLSLNAGIGSWGKISTSVNFVPRTGSNFALGDYFNLDLAQLEWIVSESTPISIFIGKVEPVIGTEYKVRKANTRFGITPSLMARYTTESQLGLKARAKLLDEWVILAAAFTNGSATSEQFFFYDETDSNNGKTFSGRAALRIPLDQLAPDLFGGALEIAIDGSAGPQDRARDSRDLMWFAGVDLEYSGVDLTVRGQFLRGGAPGRAAERVFSLDLKGAAFLEIDYMLTSFLGVLTRGELRDAFITLGTERAYLTKSWRGTAGLRVVFHPSVILKAEYLRNGQFGGLPDIKSDIFVSSLVLSF